MPKVVDHAERRATIARAFARHVAEHGFATTTYARTAAATGFSVGTVQHYFDSRDDLARAGFDTVLADRDALAELLPLDDTRRREHRVTLWLRVEGPHGDELSAIATAMDADLHRRVRTAVSNGTVCGEVEPGTDVAVATSRVLAAAHGLALELAASPGRDPAPVLDPVLATVFTGRCRRHDG